MKKTSEMDPEARKRALEECRAQLGGVRLRCAARMALADACELAGYEAEIRSLLARERELKRGARA